VFARLDTTCEIGLQLAHLNSTIKVTWLVLLRNCIKKGENVQNGKKGKKRCDWKKGTGNVKKGKKEKEKKEKGKW
jgi:hypothetical protein